MRMEQTRVDFRRKLTAECVEEKHATIIPYLVGINTTLCDFTR